MNLEIVAAVLLGISLALFCIVLPETLMPVITGFSERRKEHYASNLDSLHEFRANPMHYLAMEIICACAIAAILYVIFDAFVFGIIGFAVGYLIPNVMIQRRVQDRRHQLEAQLPDALTALSSAVRAGLSLAQSMEQVAERLPPPVKQEFALISRQYAAGSPLEEALSVVQRRLQSRHFNLICSALTINLHRGGDLTEILERIATSLRELHRMEEKMRVETAGPRFEAKVMLLVPPFVLVMFYLAQPDLVGKMFHTPVGIVMVLIAAALMFIAFLWIQKILSEDI